MYWKKSGPENTAQTVALTLEIAKQRNITDIVVASSSGQTAGMLADKGFNIVCVSHVNGFKSPGELEMADATREELAQVGVKVLTTTHVLSGAERGISRNFNGAYPVEIIAYTLRMLGPGMKVCVEIAVMALDAGLLPYGKDIIAVAGSGTGADTAVIIRPSHAADIFNTYIVEVICKPASR